MTDEAKIWKERYESLKRWVENNMETKEEWVHPWWRTVNKPSTAKHGKDMDLL